MDFMASPFLCLIGFVSAIGGTKVSINSSLFLLFADLIWFDYGTAPLMFRERLMVQVETIFLWNGKLIIHHFVAFDGISFIYYSTKSFRLKSEQEYWQTISKVTKSLSTAELEEYQDIFSFFDR